MNRSTIAINIFVIFLIWISLVVSSPAPSPHWGHWGPPGGYCCPWRRPYYPPPPPPPPCCGGGGFGGFGGGIIIGGFGFGGRRFGR